MKKFIISFLVFALFPITALAPSEAVLSPTLTAPPTHAVNASQPPLTNAETIYWFLVEECGFNSAAACGVLSNVKSESNFNPLSENSIGAYGICQWYNTRRKRLENYCAENGYASDTMEGQLHYLKWELENKYPKIYAYMLGVENSADGAYDAGYYWCYYFEIPGNKAAASEKRGTKAKEIYWPQFAPSD